MNDLEEIKKKIDLAELIGSYIELKKAGRDFKGLCPFHNEKTPSFIVSPSKGIWKCFGCQRGGDHFTFVMEHEGLDFKEAAAKLAEKAGVELKLSSGDAAESGFKKKMKEINAKAAELYQAELFRSKEAETAKNYLKKRGLTKETIIEFGLGYSPKDSSVIPKLQKLGFTNEDLVKSGVAIAGRTLYDRFRGRITFPLRDHTGDTVAFTARVLDNSLPKYLNSPETRIYRKGELLYGLDMAKQSLRDTKELIVVEGNMDVIISHQAGIKNTVATSGTALSSEQIAVLKRYTDELVLALDVDKAGVDATKRAIKLASESGLTIRVAQIPAGKDPADAITTDPEGYKKAIQNATDYVEYLLEKAKENYGTASASAKSAIAKEILPYISLIGIVERDEYLSKLADTVKLPFETLKDALKRSGEKKKEVSDEVKPARISSYERHIIYLKALVLAFPDIEKDFDQKYPGLLQNKIVSREEELAVKTLSIDLEHNLEKDPLTDAIEVAERIKRQVLKTKMNRVRESLSQAAKAGDAELQKKLMTEFKTLIEQE